MKTIKLMLRMTIAIVRTMPIVASFQMLTMGFDVSLGLEAGRGGVHAPSGDAKVLGGEIGII
jgi:hypothetical protein